MPTRFPSHPPTDKNRKSPKNAEPSQTLFATTVPAALELGPTQPEKIAPNFELPDPHILPPSIPMSPTSNDTLNPSHNNDHRSSPQHTRPQHLGGITSALVESGNISPTTGSCTGRIYHHGEPSAVPVQHVEPSTCGCPAVPKSHPKCQQMPAVSSGFCPFMHD